MAESYSGDLGSYRPPPERWLVNLSFFKVKSRKNGQPPPPDEQPPPDENKPD